MKKVWFIQYLFKYSSFNYKEVFFVGTKKWAQKRAHKYYDDLPIWIRNGNLQTWEHQAMPTKDEFIVKEYKGDEVTMQYTPKKKQLKKKI